MTDTQSKKCSRCGEVKSLNLFSKDPRKSLGVRSDCKLCHSADQKARHKANEVKLKSNRVLLANNDPFSHLAKACNKGSRKLQKGGIGGLSPKITPDIIEDIFYEQEGLCYYTRRPLDLTFYKGSGLNSRQASVDRVDPSLNYCPGNIVLCCWGVNRAKSDSTSSEFIDMCKQVVLVHGKTH